MKDAAAFRGHPHQKNAAPKTLNRRISSLSSSDKYLAAGLRVLITVPNPADAQFISRSPRVHTRITAPGRERTALIA